MLPGATPEARDLELGRLLARQGSLLLTARVETLDDAYAAYEELLTTDIRRQPIGVPFPRWTEDPLPRPGAHFAQ